MEDVSRMYHEAIATYKRLLMETAYKAPPTTANMQTVSDPSGGNYSNQPVASGNQYLSSYAPLPVYGQQQPELSSMNVRYSPEMSRAHPPAAGLVQQQQQPLPQVLPTQSVTSLPPPAYQVSLITCPLFQNLDFYLSFIRHHYKVATTLQQLESEFIIIIIIIVSWHFKMLECIK